ncbi:4-hydroxybenzoate 3-monooxygenase, partial [Streptomyces sp. NPDC059233]
DPTPLDRYSERCLAYIWRAQEFSHWMIRLLHADPEGAGGDPLFADRLRHSRIEALRTSRTQQDWFAENYVGL